MLVIKYNLLTKKSNNCVIDINIHFFTYKSGQKIIYTCAHSGGRGGQVRIYCPGVYCKKHIKLNFDPKTFLKNLNTFRLTVRVKNIFFKTTL